MYIDLSKYALFVAVLIFVPAMLVLAGCKNDTPQTETTAETQDTQENTDNSSDSTDTEASDNAAGDDKASDNTGGNPVIVIKTSKGDIKLELDRENAPITVDNFMSYVEDGFYDGTIFHRVINNFMVQGGGFTTDMQPKPTKDPIKNEADNGLKNDRGTIAMARTGVVDSATAQFFINHTDNDFLNHGKRDFGYAVFGRVVDGIEVVDAIATVQTGPGDVPNEQVVIETVEIVE